jgi:hypothetical protein
LIVLLAYSHDFESDDVVVAEKVGWPVATLLAMNIGDL